MPIPPRTRQAPTEIAPETFVIHDHAGEGCLDGVMVPVNAMVIRAAEPVVVDSGFADNRERYLDDVFGLVDPDDIRWVFVSHDDVDHTGNVNVLMAAAPNATLITSGFMVARMGCTLEVSPHRMRWIDDGGSFSVGDRTLVAIRPPVFDSPTTRGLFDPVTGVYWASDSFAAPMPELVTNAEQLDPTSWSEGMAQFHQYISPWVAMVDDAKFQRSVDRIQDLGVSTLAGCHAPTVHRPLVQTAFETMRTFFTTDVPPLPGQEALDEMIASMSLAATA